ncbi:MULTISPECIES: hypothetical protein [Clostridium]|uniref:Uncharacterized protein n=3 Tax=Clostridium TaxID=1485 RepID=D8GTP6_CLOLD|nr:MULTISPECIES: hypothetical protein [Clostridium]ADK14695.1 hypothetical protein CLJU_c16310 [Clostridium ljungdahlii DSM 13528]AGY77928.1 hypothetical protein CAETHG_3725 [Clostridium autoethanogenum DSM 10061]ALU38061.1 Hypothetical protein CLAU_3634 [Clostridium autoethanogenum DSM 10061]OAA85932.1 hypothetical protein WX45_00137 [Clostridium ljungdahlii DSM 13528]OVY50825.1 hypothetical protein WX72_01986 [Clostridium autoethanogenum]
MAAIRFCQVTIKLTAIKGRTITRIKADDIAEIVNSKIKENQAKYIQRQMIVEPARDGCET